MEEGILKKKNLENEKFEQFMTTEDEEKDYHDNKTLMITLKFKN